MRHFRSSINISIYFGLVNLCLITAILYNDGTNPKPISALEQSQWPAFPVQQGQEPVLVGTANRRSIPNQNYNNQQNAYADIANSNARYKETQPTALNKSLCPPNGTGQFPYKADCYKFINCWRGHGYIQSCSPGTMFNSLTFECDFPSKVVCANSETSYDVNNAENYDSHRMNVIPNDRSTSAAKLKSTAYNARQSPDYNSIPRYDYQVMPENTWNSANYDPSSVVPISLYQPYVPAQHPRTNPLPVDRNPNAYVYPVLTENSRSSKKRTSSNAESYVYSPGAADVDSSKFPSPSSPYNQNRPLFVPSASSFGNNLSKPPILQENYYNGQNGNSLPNQQFNTDIQQQFPAQPNVQSAKPVVVRPIVYSDRGAVVDKKVSTVYGDREYDNGRYDGNSAGAYASNNDELIHNGHHYGPSDFDQSGTSNGNNLKFPASDNSNNNKPPVSPSVKQSPPSPPKIRSSYNDNSENDYDSLKRIKCPDGFEGIMAHPINCAKYLSCAHGRTFVMDCGPGTLFNPTISVCDYPYNVDCNQDADIVSGGGKFDVRMKNPDENNQGTALENRFGQDETVRTSFATDRPKYVTSPTTTSSEIAPATLSSIKPGNIPRSTTVANYPSKTANNRTSYSNLPEYRPVYNVNANIESSISRLNNNSATGGRRSVEEIDEAASSYVVNQPATPDKQYDPLNLNSYYSPELVNVIETATSKPSQTPTVLLHSSVNELNKTNRKEDCSRRPTLRLRGGSSTSEGFLQVPVMPHVWGTVCDEPNKWTLEKANLVCRHLGYHRGAEQTWQGWPSIVQVDKTIFNHIAANRVNCFGNETAFTDCSLKPETVCDVENNAIWIRCIKNSASQCHLDEVSFNSTCYKLVIPNEANIKKDNLVGFSKEEAIKHCNLLGGRLLDILTQKENDFISEWLVNQNFMSSVMTSGIGISVFRMPVWIWEGTENTLLHQNWWPDWENKSVILTPTVESGRALCIVLQRHFTCPNKTDSICDVEYFYWNTVDCGNTSYKHPYICKRPADDIGCVEGVGSNYVGKANVTAYNLPCLPWNTSLVLSALKYKISEKVRSTYLSNHNYCRNPDGIELFPWCYVQTSDNGIQKEFCDIPNCNKSGNAELVSSRMMQGCMQGFFECTPNECVSNSQVCDGYVDCSNGVDERNCKMNVLDYFVMRPQSYLRIVENAHQRKYTNTSLKTCLEICLDTIAFSCVSFSYMDAQKICLITDLTESSKGATLQTDNQWSYYKLKKSGISCPGMFLCNNNLCIENNNVCNGRNDCGDRTDEKNCNKSSIGYEIRLTGGNSSHEGHVQVKVLGSWGYVCDDMFDKNDADVVCRELGFTDSLEVKPHSHFAQKNESDNVTSFLLDNVQCLGNESSLTECNFSEWGSHDCSSEEKVGVVCRLPGERKCNAEFFQCERSGECVPIMFLCDTVNDCSDESDEDPARCNKAVEVRLYSDQDSKSGAVFEGRVEVRRFGVWGTVCDDDFGPNEATVICRSMGYHGSAQALKEAAFGPGIGQIWLDQVHCIGNESSLTECLHSKWGQHNCKHDEDVSVICSPAEPVSKRNNSNNATVTSKPILLPKLENVKPAECSSVYVRKQKQFVQGRVVTGYTTIKGALPWQASIRLRTSGESAHWCGAVIITQHHVLTAAHCLLGYTKDFYFIRVGDFDTEVKEEHEQEFNIAEFYLHEQFNEGFKLNNDLALIKLKGTGIYFSDYVQPICLPTADEQYTVGLNCSISGWGSDATPGSGYSRLLRSANVPILPHDVCIAKHVYGNESLSGGMYCAGHLHGGPDSCQGDSGGPMICPAIDDKYFLYGITSWGHGCGRPNKPGVYTKVAYYVNWIENKLIYSSADIPSVIEKETNKSNPRH